jgi:hypothetical protein
LVSFLLLSFPAISQSVTIVNNDTLVCFPDQMVRQIVLDLEDGDHCNAEKLSLYRSIKHYQNIITLKDEVIVTKDEGLAKQKAIIDEKNKQMILLIDEVNMLRKEKGQKFWHGIYIGGGSGLVLAALVLLL